MPTSNMFDGIIDKKLLAVLMLFIEKKDDLFHIARVSKEARVPVATTFRIINQLLKSGIIEKRTIGKLKLYFFSSGSRAKKLEAMLK